MASSSQIPGFDADTVRAGLRLAMQVGLPVATQDQPLFVMPTVVTGDSDHNLDSGGTPYGADFKPTRSTPAQFRVPCAVEYFDGAGKIEAFGLVAPSHVLITLLDTEYNIVKGFAYVVLAGNKYYYEREQPPLGLVDIGVHTFRCRSDDEG